MGSSKLLSLATATLGVSVATAQLAVDPTSFNFTHPGVFLSREQLDSIAAHVAAGEQPWTLAYADMSSETLGAPTRKPQPVPVVECGPFSIPDIGCAPERSDAMAAYLNALRWVVEGEQAYADKAVEYMDAWSETLTLHNVSSDVRRA